MTTQGDVALGVGSPAPAGRGIDNDLVTVVIPARNEERFIRRCLESVQAQHHDRLQIIVVDGASEDRTVEIIEECARTDARIELLRNPDRVIPRSLNLALHSARGVWLVRVDAHATIPPDYVGRAVEHLSTQRWGGVGGRKTGVGVTSAGRAIAHAMASRFGVGNSIYHYGTTAQVVEHVPFGAYPVELARELAGWDESLRVNQDFEFDYRVRLSGRQLLFDPLLDIDWHCRQSVPDLYRQYQRYGRGKVVVGGKHPRSLRLRHLMAPALVAELTVAAVLGARRPSWGLALLAPYAIALSAATATTAAQLEDRAARRWLAPAFAAMHLGWGVGFWQGMGDLALRTMRSRWMSRVGTRRNDDA